LTGWKSKALDDLSCIDITEPDQKHNGAAMRNERLAPIWEEEQGIEITGLFEHGCLKIRLRGAICPRAQE